MINEIIKKAYGSALSVRGRTPVFGGDINRAYALELSDGSRVFMKSNTPDNSDFFRAEADGLNAMRATGCVNVPEVIGIGIDGSESFLLLEYIEPGMKNKRSSEELGADLARMHMADTAALVSDGNFGFFSDNYIGSGAQDNTPADAWIDFFANRRLRPQFERASHYFDKGEIIRFEKLLTHPDSYLEEPEHPSLLHGDLWAGNYMIDISGKPWLIDPAAYVGHAEADLAMTELFGGFDSRFYDSYREVNAISPEYSERKDLYNLYHMLNHLNLFGAGYLSSVRSILAKYT